MAARKTQSQPTEEKTLELEGLIEDSCCVKCLVLETRLKKTIDELSSAQVIIEILRSEVNIEMESLRNQCDSGNTNIKTVGVQMEQLQINNEGSVEVVGECTDGEKDDLISNQASEFNITSKSDDESWKIVNRGYKNIPLCKSYYVLPNSGNHKSV